MRSLAVGGTTLALGLPLIILGEGAAKWMGIHPALILFPAFLTYNLVLRKIWKLDTELKIYWTFEKLPHLLWGIGCGLALAAGTLAVLLATKQGIPSQAEK